MRSFISLFYILLLAIFLSATHAAAQNLSCEPDVEYQGEVNMNYGSTSNTVNSDYRSTLSIGQTVVGTVNGVDNRGSFGYFSRFLLPPSEPVVTVSQGEFSDRVQLSWTIDPLSPVASDGIKIFRDGAFLVDLPIGTDAFIDFNVQAGEFYEYEVIGYNDYGAGYPKSVVGFVNPNGVVNGRITTQNGNPVIGANVSLTPTYGQSLTFDGDDDYVCVSYDPSMYTPSFTVSLWMKIGDTHDSDGILDYGSDLLNNWWIHTTPNTSAKGIEIGVGNGTAQTLTYEFADNPDDWHHVTATFDGSTLILYVDGEFMDSRLATMTRDSMTISMGRQKNGTAYFDGNIDDVRILDKAISQGEIQQTMLRTISSTSDGLVAYWKLDEGIGNKIFDLSPQQIHGTIYNATYDLDNSAVLNSGITDDAGFYLVEGIDYSQGGSFTATPAKNFYFNQSLEFSASNEAYAELTDFDLSDSATIEIVFNAFDISNEQVIMSKGNGGVSNFEIFLDNETLFLDIEGTISNLGSITKGYHHLAVTIDQDGGAVSAQIYLDGVDKGTHSFTGVTTDWTGDPWLLGKSSNGAQPNYYTGLLDEVVFFKSVLTQGDIQLHANEGIEIADTNLVSYFNLNEGQGTDLLDMGPAMTGIGTIEGALWSTNVANPVIEPHEFTPNTRQVNINSSNTAVGNIDFTDISTVAISGVVRYENTFCFAEGIEILVNGAPYTPQIFTDVNGRFVADFEPGMDIVLTPSFSDHNFLPAFFEVRKISSPIAGVLFQDLTKRTLIGQVAGGECRYSIIDAANNTRVRVKISSSENSCYERILEFTNEDGNYTFENVPPIPLTVAVIEHSDPTINTAFQNAGGQSVDLREIENDTVDFIYYATPEVELAPFVLNGCDLPIMQQSGMYNQSIKVYQDYLGLRCYVDSADLRIVNDIADLSSFDTVMIDGEFVHQFKAGGPNILSPYNKKIEIVATTKDGSTADATQDAFVLGKKANETTFASASPQIPLFILRDPPGDASSSTLEESTTTCNSVTYDIVSSEDNNAHLTYSYGVDLETSLGLGASVTYDLDATADFGIEANISYTSGQSDGIETCITTTEAFSTSDGDLIVGDQGGDLFVGVAYNFLYGSSQDLTYDESVCSFDITTNLTVFPQNFQTRFAYSEYHIRNVEIPRLEANDSTASVNMWRDILLRNETQKANAVFKENFSFDAGAIFEKSLTSESTTSTSYTYEVENSDQIAGDLGLTINGIGVVGGFSQTVTSSESSETGSSNQSSRTVSYTLADDDVGDNFTVNIKEDRVYGTPVFQLVSGKTMCPWETNTLNREEVSISIDKNNAINIGSNEAAVFTLTVGNLSDEFKVYTVTHVPESNPNGALVKINGKQSSQDLEIDAGSTLELTMTVERGPVAYSYEDLGVAIFSACEDDRADFLGSDIDAKFYQELAFNVAFIEPCSEVDISFPLQDWVVTPDDDTLLNISIADYNISDTDLELIRVQYRKVGGDGAWINIIDIPTADLGPLFENIVWDMSLLDDGPYEIRALSQCFTGTLEPGISTIVRGRLETRPPMIFGTPQPADGILSANDEISVTFNEYIDCNSIFQADQNGNNNVGLYDATSGALIDATMSCNDGKIVLVPNIQNKFIENRTLRVELDQIPDLSGNVTGHLQWEFFVDRNPFLWLGPDIDELMTVNEPITVKRQILNRGGVTAGFEIRNIPSWVTVEPNNININPGEIVEINFTFQDDLLIGDYQQEVSLYGTEGEEPLDIRLMVRCEPPAWTFNNAAAFENTMNFALEVDIFGERSTDISDIVVAYIDDEIRGISNVEYIQELDKFMVFLTVHHDGPSDEIVLNVFDGDRCIIYADVLENYAFVSGSLIGSPLVPEVIHVENIVERIIPLAEGWNWLSFNVDYLNNYIGEVLSSLSNPSGSIIKEANGFSNNYDNVWIGSIDTINYSQRYMYKSALADTLKLQGIPYDLMTSAIKIDAGWNWIGFVPQNGMSLEIGLQSLNPLNGDLVKSQTEFAQYVAGSGWIGNLNFLNPGNGYLLNISNPGTLIYPDIENNAARDQELATNLKSASGTRKLWETDPYQFANTMSFIVDIEANDKIQMDADDEVSVLMDNEVRGSAKAQFIPEIGAYRFFITVYGNETDAEISFQYFNENSSVIFDVVERANFGENDLMGGVLDPFMLSIGSTNKVATRLLSNHLKNVQVDILGDIPNQIVNAGDDFESVNVSLFVEEDITCNQYELAYIIPYGDQTTIPECSKETFPNSMTGFLKVTFGDSLAFNSMDDRITLYNQNDVVVDCAKPYNNPLLSNEKIFYLNVGGSEERYQVDMEFYSAVHNRVFLYENVFEYVQDTEIGSLDIPIEIDFSPLNFNVSGSTISTEINDSLWRGTQGVIINLEDCDDNMGASDTIFYSIVEAGALCLDPIIFNLEIGQPSSQSCLLSNADGSINIISEFADSFSVDGGASYFDNSFFEGLTDGSYEIVVKNTGGCSALGGDLLLINDAYLEISARDSTINCTDRNAIILTSEIIHGVGPYIYQWENSIGESIPGDALVEEGQYYVTVTDAQGCSDASSLTITREVNPLDWVLPNTISGETRVCAYSQDVSYSTTVDVAISDLSWSFTDSNVDIIKSPTDDKIKLNFNENAKSGWLKLTASNYCDVYNDSMFIVVNDLGLNTTDFQTNCTDTPLVSLGAKAISGNAPYEMLWSDVSHEPVNENEQFPEGKFYITLMDGDNCEVSDSVLITRQSDPLLRTPATFISGPQMLCKGMSNVEYNLNLNIGGNQVEWTFDAVDAVLTEVNNGQSGSIDFGDNATSDFLKVSVSNHCSVVQDSILIDYANPFLCNSFSDCLENTSVTTALIESVGSPQIYRAGIGLTSNAQILNSNYEFTAGTSISLEAGFSIASGLNFVADIRDCPE